MAAKRGGWEIVCGRYRVRASGDVAQLAEHLLCKQDVVGSIPIVSTIKTPGKELFLALIESAVVPLSCQYEWHDSGPCGVSPGDVCC
jgi:hypothetical protein